MKKTRQYIIGGLLFPLLMTGCADFLDVNPKGEVFDNDMFTSAEGYEDALYGIYAELGTEDYLYSDYMLWLPEVMSINVTTENSGLLNMSQANWTATGAPAFRNGLWGTAYTAINHINNILAHIEAGGEDEYPDTPLYKGEALGLRAMLHFDMLRFFGAPAWADDNYKQRAIPYVSRYSFSITPFSTWDEACQKIVADLIEAERCLARDEELMPAVRNNASNGGFTSCRIIHMNLYAVQALLARVYWYIGDLENAAVYANKVISSGKFSFRPQQAFVQADNGTLDLNETIFGLYSTESNEKNGRQYGLTSTSSTFKLNDDWMSLYDDGSASTGSDARLSAWFNGETYCNLVNRAYIDGDDYSGNSILGVSLIRIPEMYYIMAESLLESDPTEATKYFDAVITTRGLDSFTEAGYTVTADDLYTERRKEFYGEGLHWFDMKRLGKDIQATSSILLDGSDVNTYMLPLPTSEEENRDE